MKVTDLVSKLVEALIETTPPGTARHPVVAEGLDWLREHSDDSAVLPGWVVKKQCYNCNDMIWFAKRRTDKSPNGYSWVPMIPYPVVSDKVVLDGLTIDFSNKEPTIQNDTEPGVQWLPHRVLCGRLDRPVDDELGTIWDLTTGKELIDERNAIEGMLRVLEVNEE